MAILHWPRGVYVGSAVRRVVQTITYFGEMFVAPLLAVVLFYTSTRNTGDFVILAVAGIVAWTLAEYAVHRFVLHYWAPTQHRIHHAKPSEPVLTVFWQIWIFFAVGYLIAGDAFLAGSLVAYAW